MNVHAFTDIQDEFNRRVQRTVWCSVATVDRAGRPRQRILHPIWEGEIGWIATSRHSHKAKHLESNPHLSLSYWDPRHEQVYVDCLATWEDDPAEKRRVWALFTSQPPPYGYDPALFWPDGPDRSDFGALKLTPWRIELFQMTPGFREPPRVWRAVGAAS